MTKCDEIIVYCLTAPNGKQYIGVTKNLDVRLGAHSRYQSPIGHAIRKYGLGSFRVAVLARTASYSAAYEIERAEVDRLGTLCPVGYNLTTGGVGGRSLCDETRAKIAAAQRGKTRGPHSDEVRRKIAESVRRSWLQRDHHMTNEAKQNHEEAMRRPEVRRRLSAAARHQFADPEQRRRQSHMMRKRRQREAA